MKGQQGASFPETYAKLSSETLIEAYAAGPRRVRTVISGLTREETAAKPLQDKWSIREIAAHVADSEVIGAGRIRQTFAQPGSTFAFYNQDIWADAFAYRALDDAAFEAYLDLFDSLRLTTKRIFQQAGEADWGKAGLHPELGMISLRQLLELYADHSERHVAQILNLRQMLGKPLRFPLLLETRLY